MLLAQETRQYFIYKVPEYSDPDAIDCLEWSFSPSRVPVWLKYYIKNWNLGPTQYAVVFFGNDENSVDGVFKFNFQEKNKTMIAKGTLINPKHRKKGAAKKMWNLAIDAVSPEKIVAFASTCDGLRFLKKMAGQHSNIAWKIEETI